MKKKLEKWYKSPAYRFLALVILLTVVLLLADFGLILPNCSTKTKLITHGLYLIGFYNAICAIREKKSGKKNNREGAANAAPPLFYAPISDAIASAAPARIMKSARFHTSRPARPGRRGKRR